MFSQFTLAVIFMHMKSLLISDRIIEILSLIKILSQVAFPGEF